MKTPHRAWLTASVQTSVGVAQWASYQSERNFCDADKFVPERWLGDPKYAHDVRDVLQPFSVGPRNCIGKKYVISSFPLFNPFVCVSCVPAVQASLTLGAGSLAYAEMRLILARLLWKFDLELMPESRNWSDQKIYTLWEKGAINVKLSPASR